MMRKQLANAYRQRWLLAATVKAWLMVFLIGRAFNALFAGDKQTSPETFYVQVERAEVYAGPDQQFYPTGNLERGTAIDVFMTLENGWLGIRPPQGSFSWLPASQGYLLPGGKSVEVTDGAAVSWIGTELGTAKQYRWQVQLQLGEQLTVVGEAMIKHHDEAPSLWYKVAPPNGEFRWIRSEAVSKTPPFISKPVGRVEPVQLANGQSQDMVPNDVTTANYEEPSIVRAKANSQRAKAEYRAESNSKASGVQKDPWAGYHAFDFSSGALSFLGLLPRPPLSTTSPRQTARQTDPSELIARRGWRDPRELQARRIANSAEVNDTSNLQADSPVPATDFMLTPYENTLSQVGPAISTISNMPPVTTVSAERVLASEGVSKDAFAADAWYGIHQASTSPATGTSATGLLTLTAKGLSEIHLAVSEIVAQPMVHWNLQGLADRTRYLVEHGSNAVERGEARLLLERIEGFQVLATKNASLTAGSMSQSQLPGTLSPFQLTSAKNTFGVQPTIGPSPWSFGSGLSAAESNHVTPSLPYDATGWLVPVHAAKENQQEMYALTNDSGKVIVYVSPIAGLNLGRYLNQPVGIYGLRGYLPQLRTNHIEAQRVVRLK